MSCEDQPPILALPEELSRMVFTYLDPKSVINCYYVCAQWSTTIRELYPTSTWKKWCTEDYPFDYKNIRSKSTMSSSFDIYRSLTFFPVAVCHAKEDMTWILKAHHKAEYKYISVHKGKLFVVKNSDLFCVSTKNYNKFSHLVNLSNLPDTIEWESYQMSDSILALTFTCKGKRKNWICGRKDNKSYCIENILPLAVTDILRLRGNRCDVIIRNTSMFSCLWKHGKWSTKLVLEKYGKRIKCLNYTENKIYVLNEGNFIDCIDKHHFKAGSTTTSLNNCTSAETYIRYSSVCYIFNECCDIVQSTEETLYYGNGHQYCGGCNITLPSKRTPKHVLKSWLVREPPGWPFRADRVTVLCPLLSCAVTYQGCLIIGDLFGRVQIFIWAELRECKDGPIVPRHMYDFNKFESTCKAIKQIIIEEKDHKHILYACTKCYVYKIELDHVIL